MNNIDVIFYVAVIGSLVAILMRKLFNFTEYSKLNVVEINSADQNISSAKVAEMIKKFLLYLDIRENELKVNYESTETYSRVFSMLNRKRKEITIPKWVLPSVGYEIDYLLASIWYNVKLFKKDKGVRRMQLVAHIFPIIFIFTYYLLLTLVFILFLTRTFIMPEAEFKTSFLFTIANWKILEVTNLAFFILYIICEFYSTKIKMLLEINYERSIIKFVDEELIGYKNDISAARVFALQVRKMNYDSFRINAKTSNLKYLGPFVTL